MPSVVEFPFEILMFIFRNLHVEDIKNSRTTCRSFHDVASEYLIKHVYIWAHPESFDRLRKIANHPIFRRTVRDIHYSTDCYHLQLDSESAYLEIREYLYRCQSRSCPVLVGAELTQSFEAYHNAALSQSELNWNGAEEGMAAAFSLMPSISTVVVRRSYSLKLPKRLHEDTEIMITIRPPPSSEQEMLEEVPVQGCWGLFRALSQARARVSQLYIGAWNISNWSVTRDISVTPSWLLKDACNFYQYLKVIELNVQTADYLRNQADNRPQLLLWAAQSIEDLSLNFAASDDSFVPLRDIIGDTTWPRLRSAKFCGVEASDEDLIEFYNRHSSCLNEIKVDGSLIYVTDLGKSFRLSLSAVLNDP